MVVVGVVVMVVVGVGVVAVVVVVVSSVVALCSSLSISRLGVLCVMCFGLFFAATTRAAVFWLIRHGDSLAVIIVAGGFHFGFTWD